ncbi:hypothetical protein [Spirosoma arcticum]
MAKDKSEQPVEPNSALRSLDRLVGTWQVSDEAQGQITFRWMEGGYFLIQEVDLNGGAKGIEFIGYDAESKTLKSHYFNNTGNLLEYTYKTEGKAYTVAIDMPGRKGQFVAEFSDDDNTLTGRWDWTQDGEKMGYNATMRRMK